MALKGTIIFLKLFRKLGGSSCFVSIKTRRSIGPNELVQFYRTCIEPITEYACPVLHDGLPVYLSRELEIVQKTAIGIIFPCFLYEEALLKTSLVTLSDQKQARLMDKLFKKILGNKRLHSWEFYCPTKCQAKLKRYNLRTGRQPNSVFKTDISQ